MQAYATPERRFGEVKSRGADRVPRSCPESESNGSLDMALLDGLLGRLADLVVDRLLERATETRDEQRSDWMDARTAAGYLGIHRDTLRKLAAERAVPVHQDAPGCKLYFRRDELDAWRRLGPHGRTRLRPVS